MDTFSLSRMLSETSQKKILLLWLMFMLSFSGIFYSLTLTDGNLNYITLNGEKEERYAYHLLFSAIVGLKLDGFSIEAHGNVMRFMAIIHMIVSAILICAMISKYILKSSGDKIEKLHKSKMRRRVKEIITKIREIKEDIKTSPNYKASQAYRLALNELKRYSLENDSGLEFARLTSEVFEILAEKNIGEPRSIENFYFASYNCEKIINAKKASSKKKEEFENAIAAINEWKEKIIRQNDNEKI